MVEKLFKKKHKMYIKLVVGQEYIQKINSEGYWKTIKNPNFKLHILVQTTPTTKLWLPQPNYDSHNQIRTPTAKLGLPQPNYDPRSQVLYGVIQIQYTETTYLTPYDRLRVKL